MFGHLDLTRDPTRHSYEDSTYVESKRRAGAYAACAAALDAGNSLWVRGPAGSGRESLVARLASRYAPGAARASATLTRGQEGSAPLLRRLHSNIAGANPSEEALDLAEGVYGKLFEGFRAAGPCLIFICPPDSLDGADLTELLLLGELTFLGLPVARIVACGEGPPPVEGMAEVVLEEPDAGELTGFLRQRLALCGGSSLLGAAEEACGAAGGYSGALGRLGEVLGVRSFMPPPAAGVKPPPPTSGESAIFSPGAVEEVEWLLDAISRKKQR